MNRLKIRLLQVGILLAVFCILEAASRTGLIGKSVLPAAPSVIIGTLFDFVFVSGTIWPAFGVTVTRVLVAFAITSVIGFTLGLALWRIPLIASAFESIIASLYAVPWMAMYPIFLVLMGLGDGPIITIATILGFVPLALNTYVGLKAMRTVYLKVGLVNGCTRWQMLVKILIPAAIPYIVAGLKLSFLYTYLGVLGPEFLRSTHGLGFLVFASYTFFQDVELYAYILFVITVTLTLFYGLDRLDRTVARRFS